MQKSCRNEVAYLFLTLSAKKKLGESSGGRIGEGELKYRRVYLFHQHPVAVF